MKKTFKNHSSYGRIMATFALSSCSDSDNGMMDMSFQRTITFENVVT
jgi:hypothetical protein